MMMDVFCGTQEVTHEIKRMGKYLREGFWVWRLLSFLRGYKKATIVNISNIDGELEKHYPAVKDVFQKRWGVLKPDDMGVIVFDGGLVRVWNCVHLANIQKFS